MRKEKETSVGEVEQKRVRALHVVAAVVAVGATQVHVSRQRVARFVVAQKTRFGIAKVGPFRTSYDAARFNGKVARQGDEIVEHSSRQNVVHHERPGSGTGVVVRRDGDGEDGRRNDEGCRRRRAEAVAQRRCVGNDKDTKELTNLEQLQNEEFSRIIREIVDEEYDVNVEQ